MAKETKPQNPFQVGREKETVSIGALNYKMSAGEAVELVADLIAALPDKKKELDAAIAAAVKK